MSANSLTNGIPTAVQVIPSDNKENKTPAAAAAPNSNQRNIVLSKEVVRGVNYRLTQNFCVIVL